MEKEKDVGWLVPWRVFFTIFRGWIGAAFVSMPYGFMASGYVVATLSLLFLGALSAYCAMLTLRVKVCPCAFVSFS
jgi:amino acid permease